MVGAAAGVGGKSPDLGPIHLGGERRRPCDCRRHAAARSYQPFVEFTTRTTRSITGTSISTPTTVASAAPDSKPNIPAERSISPHFEAILDGTSADPLSQAPQFPGLSETGLKVAIHRSRVRFRELIRAEVVATVYDPADTGGALKLLVTIVTTSSLLTSAKRCFE